jgi:type IV pilus assembly protein PilA
MRRTQQGFTIIELIIVVAIVGLLASIALPAFQNFAKRAKLSEVLAAASSCRSPISEVYLIGGQDSVPANGWGCESAVATSKYVASIATDENGKVMVTSRGIGGGIDGTVLTLTPTDMSGSPMVYAPGTKIGRWVCGAAAHGTTIPDKYLPGSCRGL